MPVWIVQHVLSGAPNVNFNSENICSEDDLRSKFEISCLSCAFRSFIYEIVTKYYRIYKLTPLRSDRQHHNAKEHTEIIDRHDFIS